jgi:hypothetical protein
MSKEQRRDYWWSGLMVIALGFFGLCTYGYMTGFFS